MITDAVMNLARDNLERRAAALNGIEFREVVCLDFSFKEIRAGFGRGAISARIKQELGEGFKSAAIYRLTVNDQAGAKELQKKFDGYEPQNGHKLPQNNKVANSTTVYVGSSKKIGQRLQQHLNTCAAGTYALKMHLWCPDADNGIKVEVSSVCGAPEASLVQDIEDALWRSSLPMFGKRGPR